MKVRLQNKNNRNMKTLKSTIVVLAAAIIPVIRVTYTVNRRSNLRERYVIRTSYQFLARSESVTPTSILVSPREHRFHHPIPQGPRRRGRDPHPS